MCDDYASHLRVTTVSNKTETKVFKIIYFRQPDKNKITSNSAQGGKTCFLENGQCVRDNKIHFEIPPNVMSKLEEVKKIAVQLHKQLKSNILAWDIIFTCEDYYFLEANYGGGVCLKDVTNAECMGDYFKFMFSDL